MAKQKNYTMIQIYFLFQLVAKSINWSKIITYVYLDMGRSRELENNGINYVFGLEDLY